jgi:hypothetical protein
VAEHRGERREASRRKRHYLNKEVHAAQVGQIAEFRDRLAGEERIEARDKFTGDPEGFKTWAQSRPTARLPRCPAGWCRTPSSSSREFEGAYGAILGERRAQDRHLDGQAIVARTKMADDDVMSIAATGKLNTPEGKAASRPTRACSARGQLRPDGGGSRAVCSPRI